MRKNSGELANEFLTQPLGKDIGQIGLKAISESKTQKLKKVGSCWIVIRRGGFLVK